MPPKNKIPKRSPPLETYEAEQFPPTLLRTKTNPQPTVYQFGILLPTQTLVDYADHKNLVSEDIRDRPMHYVCAITRTIQHLERVATARLYEARADGSFGPGHLVVTLYSNYNITRRRLVKEDEQDIVEIIQRELGTSEAPKWYWDSINGFPDADRPSLS
ncbi:hypothetical protein DFH06DRAFT_1141028 [Mycena polygramma]|nr:hypothetical protein DFH06DRAFT_1141028 [Mycena polygramma]